MLRVVGDNEVGAQHLIDGILHVNLVSSQIVNRSTSLLEEEQKSRRAETRFLAKIASNGSVLEKLRQKLENEAFPNDLESLEYGKLGSVKRRRSFNHHDDVTDLRCQQKRTSKRNPLLRIKRQEAFDVALFHEIVSDEAVDARVEMHEDYFAVCFMKEFDSTLKTNLLFE